MVLGLSAFVVFASYSMPADGWIVDRGFWGRYSNPVFIWSLPGTNPDLQPGDILLEIDGKPFETLESRAATFRSRRPANWEFGRTVQYKVLRNELEVVVPVTLQRPPLATGYKPGILKGSLDTLTTPAYLLISVFLFLMRPRQRASQLIFLFAMVFFTVDIATFRVGAPAGAADLFSPATYWLRILLADVSWFLLGWPVLVHLFLIFPLPKPAVHRYSLIIPLVYGLPILICLLYMLLSVQGYYLPGESYAVILIVPFLLIVVLSLFHSLLAVKEQVARVQMRWIAFGGLVGIAGTIIVALVEALVLGSTTVWSDEGGIDRFWLGFFLLILSLALPISLAISVLRYRLWDIDIIINRSLVYGTLTGALALIYFGSVLLLEALFRGITGQSSPIAIVISTLVIAGLFSPLRSRVQRFIDRRLYRRKYNAERIMERFAASVRDETDLDRLTAELQRVSMRAMQAEHVSIWLKKPASDRWIGMNDREGS
jgi:hypothetical protein